MQTREKITEYFNKKIMNDYLISGIQQMGIGCTDFHEAWAWYIDMFKMDVRVLEDDTVAERMLPYTGGVPQRRHACIALNLQGGGGFEIWQYAERRPRPAAQPAAAGDLGIFAATIKSRCPESFRRLLCDRRVQAGPLAEMPDGTPSFFVRDPWDNCFRVVQDTSVYIERGWLGGGITGAMIGCSDIDRSLHLYRDLLGYGRTVYDRTGCFADLAFLPGGQGRFRRVLLADDGNRQGAFARLYGAGTIELVQALDRKPVKIYEGRFWGDPGFIQLCMDVTNMRGLERRFAAEGFPFTVDSCRNDGHFDMGEASGHFVYVEDPDGTLIELVEAHKLTILKRPHLAINMLARDRRKPFPKLLFRLLGRFASVSAAEQKKLSAR